MGEIKITSQNYENEVIKSCKAIPDISNTMLASTLKDLEAND